MKKILFICLGNICRSPLAKGIAQKISNEKNLNYEIDSAGTSSWHIGEKACRGSIEVAKQNRVDITSHKARQICENDIFHYDYIVAMDDRNYRDLKEFGVKNLLKLGDFGYQGKDVPDPYFFPDTSGFPKVFEMIEVCINNLIENIENKIIN